MENEDLIRWQRVRYGKSEAAHPAMKGEVLFYR
jgi:hypothetical protein